MHHIEKEMLVDCSTKEEFCFSLQCEECGRIWKSRPVRFSKAGVIPKTEGKTVIFRTLSEKEKNMALIKAVRQAEKKFSRCPICHRLVCDHCFMVCEDLDMCASCAGRLQEKGEPVADRSQKNIDGSEI